jgi:hypothetical protein
MKRVDAFKLFFNNGEVNGTTIGSGTLQRSDIDCHGNVEALTMTQNPSKRKLTK